MENKNILAFGLIISLGLIVAASIPSYTFLSAKRMEDVVSVSGSAKTKVTSDSARWTASFSRTIGAAAIKDGYAQMAKDEKAINDFLAKQGLDKEKIEISPVSMNEVYRNDQNAPREYNLVQNVQVKSTDVNKMKEVAKNSESLAAGGIMLSAYPVEYYFNGLPDLRISLLPEAIKDAKKRAETIAESSGRKIDAVKSVAMGVVQVMPVGVVDVSDYGSYDTSSIEKEVMITVKASFDQK